MVYPVVCLAVLTYMNRRTYLQGVRKLFATVYLAVISPRAHGTGVNSTGPRLRLSTTVG